MVMNITLSLAASNEVVCSKIRPAFSTRNRILDADLIFHVEFVESPFTKVTT